MPKHITRRMYDLSRWMIDNRTPGACPWEALGPEPDGRHKCVACYDYLGLEKPDVIGKDGLCCPCAAMGNRELFKVVRGYINLYEQENGRPYE